MSSGSLGGNLPAFDGFFLTATKCPRHTKHGGATKTFLMETLFKYAPLSGEVRFFPERGICPTTIPWSPTITDKGRSRPGRLPTLRSKHGSLVVRDFGQRRKA
jgi:hypothetical protein